MKTYMDCIPCFFRQAIRTSRRLGLDEGLQKRIINEICREVMRFPLTCSPPEMGRFIYAAIRKNTGIADPFKDIKVKSNEIALRLYPHMKEKVKASPDPLLFALKVAAAGNVIDYGIPKDVDMEKEIFRLIENDLALLDYDEFREALEASKNLLYIADNAGEIVFDKILIEEIESQYPKHITLIVRGAPIINDATLEDAVFCGLTDTVKVVQNGYDAPGTILTHCSKEFLGIYNKSDIIISKGQGNFESLSGQNKNIFFLFKAKCDVVASHVGIHLGDMAMVSNKRYIIKK